MEEGYILRIAYKVVVGMSSGTTQRTHGCGHGLGVYGIDVVGALACMRHKNEAVSSFNISKLSSIVVREIA